MLGGGGQRFFSSAWTSHEAVVFGSAFSDARFGAVWSVKHEVLGEDSEQEVKKAGVFAKSLGSAIE